MKVLRAGGVAVAATLLFVVAGLFAKDDLRTGKGLVYSGVDALRTGDYELAGERLHAAADHLGQADDWLSSVLTAPARLVPGLAQNREATATLSRAAALGLRNAANAIAYAPAAPMAGAPRMIITRIASATPFSS